MNVNADQVKTTAPSSGYCHSEVLLGLESRPCCLQVLDIHKNLLDHGVHASSYL